jgi:hypothetical protein
LPLIRFNRRVTHLAWSSAEALWTVTVHETQPGDERGAAAGPAQTIFPTELIIRESTAAPRHAVT